MRSQDSNNIHTVKKVTNGLTLQAPVEEEDEDGSDIKTPNMNQTINDGENNKVEI
jgi:hypothetical protein